MLDAKTERLVAQVAEQIRELFGPDLVSLVLYGSAAGGDFTAGRSDLNLAIVLQRVTFTHLTTLQRCLPRWRKRGVATPLLIDRSFLERARDVFPGEFLDIKAQHRVLYGEEVFATLRIDPRHLRYQAEHEARSKLLRLRALYAEVGADRSELETLMLESVKTFLVIMRNLLRLRDGAGEVRYSEVLEHFERVVAVGFPIMRQILQARQEQGRLRGHEEMFASYLEEVERLVDLIDRDLPETPPTPPESSESPESPESH